MRRPSKVEQFVQFTLGLNFAIFMVDHFRALSAQACTPDGPDVGCYPWGVDELTDWAYASKAHYLVSSWTTLALLLLAFCVPYLVRRRAVSILGMIGIAIGGNIAAGYLLPELLP
jgi:hypothetical protein